MQQDARSGKPLVTPVSCPPSDTKCRLMRPSGAASAFHLPALATLLWMSRSVAKGWVFELPVELAGDVTLETAADFGVGFAFAASPFGIGLRRWIVA